MITWMDTGSSWRPITLVLLYQSIHSARAGRWLQYFLGAYQKLVFGLFNVQPFFRAHQVLQQYRWVYFSIHKDRIESREQTNRMLPSRWRCLSQELGSFADCSGIWQCPKDDVTALCCRGERRETYFPFALTWWCNMRTKWYSCSNIRGEICPSNHPQRANEWVCNEQRIKYKM